MNETREIIAYGRTAELLAYGEGHVLKLFRANIPTNLVEEEFRISMNVYRCGVAIPQPIQIVDYKDRKGIVYQKLTGATMLSVISKKPWSVHKESKRMASLHAAIHTNDVLDLPNQKDILRACIERAPLLTSLEKDRIIQYLNGLKEGSKLCHGDYHPDNIILGEREWIIDWMTGMRGNPAGDVARSVLLLQLGTMPDETPRLINFFISRIRNQILKTYLKCYISYSKIDRDEVDNWILPIAAARLNEWIPEKEKQALVNLIRQRLQ
ncbi:phosphotransferase family protein [Paenibacillus marinisediminis]